jgi:hypothetical protein
MSKLFRKNPQTAGRVIGGQAFVVTPDDNKLHTLNATATCLWQLAHESCTAEEAAARLVEEFEVDLPTARRDVATCFEDLVARQILVAE